LDAVNQALLGEADVGRMAEMGWYVPSYIGGIKRRIAVQDVLEHKARPCMKNT
jgi:hypothetical protein